MVRNLVKAAAAVALGASLTLGAANATDLNVAVENYSASYNKQRAELNDNKVEDGSALNLQNGSVIVAAKSGQKDDLDISIDNYSAGFNDQDVKLNNNTVSGGSTLNVQNGSVVVTTN